MSTGERIKQLRVNKGLSQEELGALIGVQKAAIHKYESGIVVNLKRSTIDKLAQALNTTPAYLMGWEDEAPNKSRPSGDERVDEILAKNEVLREFYDILKTLPEEQQTELLETAIFLAEKKAQQQRK